MYSDQDNRKHIPIEAPIVLPQNSIELDIFAVVQPNISYNWPARRRIWFGWSNIS